MSRNYEETISIKVSEDDSGIIERGFMCLRSFSTLKNSPLTDASHEQYGFHELYNLFESRQLCDVTLRIFMDGKIENDQNDVECENLTVLSEGNSRDNALLNSPHEIFCHKIVLACYSAYFNAMFKSKMIESQSNIVTMYNIDPQAMEDLVRFCYNGSLQLNWQNVLSVMHTACVLQMERALPLCEQYVLRNLSVEHALDIRKFAHLYHLKNLMIEVDRFIAINFISMMNLNEAKEMPFEVLFSVLKHKQLIVRSEIEVASCVLKWVSCDPAQRKKYFPKLVLLLHLLHLPFELLDGNIYIPDVQLDKAADVYCRSILRLMMHSKEHKPHAIQDMAQMIYQAIGPLQNATQFPSESEHNSHQSTLVTPPCIDSGGGAVQQEDNTESTGMEVNQSTTPTETEERRMNVEGANDDVGGGGGSGSTNISDVVYIISSENPPIMTDNSSLSIRGVNNNEDGQHPYSISQLDYSPVLNQDFSHQNEINSVNSSNESSSFTRMPVSPVLDRLNRRVGVSVNSSSSSSRNALRDASQLGMNPNPMIPAAQTTSSFPLLEDRLSSLSSFTNNTSLRLSTSNLFSNVPHYLQPPVSSTTTTTTNDFTTTHNNFTDVALTFNQEKEDEQLLEYLELMRPRSSYAGVVLCVGGRGCPNTPYAEVEVYDPLTETWYSMPKMLTPRRHVGLIAYRDQVYAIGGHDGRRHLSSGEAFAATDGRWLSMQPMNTARRGLALAWLGNTLFCLGGLDDSTCFKTVERFNFVTNQWQNVSSMRSQRGGLAVATIRDHIIAMGGNDSHSSVNTCEMFDPYAQTWQTIACMSDKRAGASGAMVDGVVYVVGGFDDNMPLSSIERYDERIGRWFQLNPMKHARGGVGAAALGGLIYAVGGHNGEAYLSSTEVYDPAMNRWRDGASLQTQRAGGGVCAFDIPLREFMPSLSPLADSIV